MHAANGGRGILSKSLSDRVIKLANEELFGPRGLVVRLYTTDAVRALVRTGHEGPAPSGGNKLFNAGKHVPILGGIIRKLGPVGAPLPTPSVRALTACDRSQSSCRMTRAGR
jgi:hypothetical protein